MDPNERQTLIREMNIGRDALLKAIQDVSEDAARRRPQSGWSVLECVEHLVVAEAYLFGQIAAAAHSAEPVINRVREAAIMRRGLDRTRKVEAPAAAKPTGRFRTLDEARQSFLTCRQKTMDFLERFDGDLRALLTTHPLLGQVNCYETLLIIAIHPQRHAQQIEQIKRAVQS